MPLLMPGELGCAEGMRSQRLAALLWPGHAFLPAPCHMRWVSLLQWLHPCPLTLPLSCSTLTALLCTPPPS